jgi:hypothetical protein
MKQQGAISAASFFMRTPQPKGLPLPILPRTSTTSAYPFAEKLVQTPPDDHL